MANFSTARKDQYSNVLKREKIMVVWDDHATLLVVRNIEVQTINLLHRTRGPVDDEDGGHI